MKEIYLSKLDESLKSLSAKELKEVKEKVYKRVRGGEPPWGVRLTPLFLPFRSSIVMGLKRKLHGLPRRTS